MPRKLTVSDNIVLEFIEKKQKALTQDEICKGVNLPPEKFNPCMNRLMGHALIRKTSEGKYRTF